MASFAWQVFTHFQRRREQEALGRTKVVLDANQVHGPDGDAIVMTVYNYGEHKVRVTAATFIEPEAPTASFYRPVNVTVEPRDSQEIEFPLPDPGLDLHEPWVPWVRLSTDEEVRSDTVFHFLPDR